LLRGRNIVAQVLAERRKSRAPPVPATVSRRPETPRTPRRVRAGSRVAPSGRSRSRRSGGRPPTCPPRRTQRGSAPFRRRRCSLSLPQPGPCRRPQGNSGAPRLSFTDAGASPHDSLPNDPTAWRRIPRRRRDAFPPRGSRRARRSLEDPPPWRTDGACSRPRPSSPSRSLPTERVRSRCSGWTRAPARPAPEKDAPVHARRSRAVGRACRMTRRNRCQSGS